MGFSVLDISSLLKEVHVCMITNCKNIVRIECLDWKEKRKLSTLGLPDGKFPHHERSGKKNPSTLLGLPNCKIFAL
jgi:hypothetical protein